MGKILNKMYLTQVGDFKFYRKQTKTQSFTLERIDGKIFGCSFKLAPNGQYFGWVTEYPNKKAYNKLSTWTDWKNIPLDIEINKSKDMLLDYIKNIN